MLYLHTLSSLSFLPYNLYEVTICNTHTDKGAFMNYAIIDLGSNSIRLSVYSCENDKMEEILSKKEIAGLAGYVSNGVLEISGIQRACKILNTFKLTALKFAEPSNIHLFAAASLRNIKNRDEAIKIIVEETSLIPDILDGEEEAALGFSGASQFASYKQGIMIDIGGASTELVLFKDYKAVDFISLPIGCLNLHIRYVHKVVPTKNEIKRIKKKVWNQLVKINWEEDAEYPLIVGTGGTLRAALKLSCVLFDLPHEQNSIQVRQIKNILKQLKDSEDNIYRTVYKTIPERVFTISTGLIILQQVIKKFGSESITVSKYGIREGYLKDRVLKTNERCDTKEENNES